MIETFGTRVRKRRTELGLGLRETAKLVEISPTFLSRIETEAEPAMPSEEVIQRLANVLNEDCDTLMSLAGRIPSDVQDIVNAEPGLPEFLRRAHRKGISVKRLMEMIEDEGKRKRSG